METRSGKTSATFLLNGRSSDFVLDCLHHYKLITNPLIKSPIKPSSKTYIKYVQFLDYTSTYRVEKLKFALTMLEDPGYLQHIWPVLKKKNNTHKKHHASVCFNEYMADCKDVQNVLVSNQNICFLHMLAVSWE